MTEKTIKLAVPHAPGSNDEDALDFSVAPDNSGVWITFTGEPGEVQNMKVSWPLVRELRDQLTVWLTERDL